jgi:hypothetical protein
MKYVFSSLVALGLVASALGLTTAQAADGFACWAESFTKAAPGLIGLGLPLLESHHWISHATARSWEAKLHQAEVAQAVRDFEQRVFGGPSATASCERK